MIRLCCSRSIFSKKQNKKCILIVVLLPFLLGFDSSIRHQLISNASQDIGGRLCCEDDRLDHRGGNLPNHGPNSSSHALLVVLNRGQLGDRVRCLSNTLQITFQ